MKISRITLLILMLITVVINSCSDDNSPGGSSNNNNNGGGSNSGGCVGGPTTVTDYDGNIYNVVTIGNQCWTKENLRTTHFKNGALIPGGLNDATWIGATSAACANYNDSAINSLKYGKLYNWYAVSDPRGLCPTGWHVPSDLEWTDLENHLGGNILAGGAMKEIGLTHWASPNTGATNSTGFTGLPGGLREIDGSYRFIEYFGTWWCSSPYVGNTAICRSLDYDSSDLLWDANSYNAGQSVRCVRD